MEHHLSEAELKGYGSRAMTASALLDADRHLGECAACRRQLRQTVPAPGLPAAALEVGEPAHLTYEQMVAHVSARLSEAELTAVEDHRSICRRCAKELAELHAFDACMATEFAVAAAKKPGLHAEPRASWPQAVRAAVANFFATPMRLRFAGAGVALMLMGIFTLLRSGTPAAGSGTAVHVTANLVAASAAAHPHLFYGGFVVAGCGAGALLYAVFKR
jgi:hypothetical protein